jgi:O-antigen/teichoic acid export membrane protein
VQQQVDNAGDGSMSPEVLTPEATPPVTRPSFLRNAFAYSGTNLIAQFTQLASRFFVRTLLAPEAMGLWEFALVIQTFANSFDPGVNTAASVELPVLHGANQRGKESLVRSTVLYSNFIFSLVLAAGIFVYLSIHWREFDRYKDFAVIVAAIMVVLFSVSSSLITIHQGNQSYVSLSKASVYYSVLYALFVALGAYLKGIIGVLIAGAVSYFLQAVLLWIYTQKEQLKIERAWDKETFKRLIKFGLPLRVVEYPQSFFAFLDVFLVTKFLGISQLAIYAIARVFFIQTANIPAVLGTVFITRIFYLSGAKTSRKTLAEEMKTFLFIEYLVVLPLLICSVCVLFSFLTHQFIPAYASSVPVIQNLIFACYFVPQTTLVRNFWMLDKRLVSLGLSNVVGVVAMSASFFVLFETRGLTLNSIAVASVAGYFLYYVYIMMTVGRELWGVLDALNLVMHAVVAVGITKLILATMPIGTDQRDFYSNAIQLVSNIGRACLLLLPIIVYGVWRTRLIPYLRTRFARKDLCPE